MTKKMALAAAFAVVLAAQAPDMVSERNLRADLNFLCSDALAGRESMTPGAAAAAQFIATEFERAGLAPAAGGSYLQEFPLVAFQPDRARTRLTIDGEPLEYGTQFTGAFPREVTVKAPVVFAGYGITAPEYGYDDYTGIDARGKIVLIFDHEPQETDPKSVFNGVGETRYGHIRTKMENAIRHGAVGMLVVSEPLRKHRGAFDPRPRTADGRSVRATAPRQVIDETTSIPDFSISDAAAQKLLSITGKTPSELQAAIDGDLRPASQPLRNTEVTMSTAVAHAEHGRSANVVGLLEGSDPALKSETVILSAHYDHLGVHNGQVYRGANDNASGSVAVMELARMFARDRPRPKRSLLFIVFGSEEESLSGSFYYAEHPLRPLDTTRAVVNLDMIGRDEAHIPQSRGVVDIPADTSNELNLVGTFYSPDLQALILEANRHTGLELSTKFDRDHDLNVLYRCDHFPFLVHGVPAVWFFGGFHPGYHEPIDTVDRLDFPKLEKVVRLAYWTARSIADGKNTPKFIASGPD